MPALKTGYSYDQCVDASVRVSWSLDDVFPEGTELDFSRPFLPEPLCPTQAIGCLDERERVLLNQIAGNAYLNLFAFVEEYILAATIQYLSAAMFGDRDSIRALSRFADEEVKHQELFNRFRASFDAGVGQPCGVLENAVEVAGIILGKTPMAVVFTTLHIEWMTQQHYTACVQGNDQVDPLFAELLKCHWLEESQHAKIDALELEKMVDYASDDAIKTAFDEYLGILEAFDGLLLQQAELDVASIAARTGRSFSDAEAAEIKAAQHQGYRTTFLVYGLTNPQWQKIQVELSPEGRDRCQAAAAGYGA